MSKIDSVSCTVACIPLETATAFSSRVVRERHYLLVKVRSDDGIEGIGFCYVGSAAGRLGVVAVEDLLAPVVVGKDPLTVEKIWKDMYAESLLQGRAGTVMRAFSAIDVAIWDRNARAAGLPLWRYLGGAADTSVPAYASGGYYIDGKTPAMLGEEVAGWVAKGFRAVKIKVGRLTPKEEEARIAAARQAIGDDILLMLDANNAWDDLPTALEYMRRYEPYNPYWIEEPFSPDDIDSHARLAAATPVTVATGEIEYGRWRFKELLDKEAAGILQTDALVCGGISEFRRIAAMAAGYGVKICPHWFHDLHIHLVAASPNGQFVEFFLDDTVLNFRKLVGRQLEFKDGALLLPEEPGIGFDFKEEAVARYGSGWVTVGHNSANAA